MSCRLLLMYSKDGRPWWTFCQTRVEMWGISNKFFGVNQKFTSCWIAENVQHWLNMSTKVKVAYLTFCPVYKKKCLRIK